MTDAEWQHRGWTVLVSGQLTYVTPDGAWRVRTTRPRVGCPVRVSGYHEGQLVATLTVETPRALVDCPAETYAWLARHRAWQQFPDRYDRPAAPPEARPAFRELVSVSIGAEEEDDNEDLRDA